MDSKIFSRRANTPTLDLENSAPYKVEPQHKQKPNVSPDVSPSTQGSDAFDISINPHRPTQWVIGLPSRDKSSALNPRQQVARCCEALRKHLDGIETSAEAMLDPTDRGSSEWVSGKGPYSDLADPIARLMIEKDVAFSSLPDVSKMPHGLRLDLGWGLMRLGSQNPQHSKVIEWAIDAYQTILSQSSKQNSKRAQPSIAEKTKRDAIYLTGVAYHRQGILLINQATKATSNQGALRYVNVARDKFKKASSCYTKAKDPNIESPFLQGVLRHAKTQSKLKTIEGMDANITIQFSRDPDLQISDLG